MPAGRVAKSEGRDCTYVKRSDQSETTEVTSYGGWVGIADEVLSAAHALLLTQLRVQVTGVQCACVRRDDVTSGVHVFVVAVWQLSDRQLATGGARRQLGELCQGRTASDAAATTHAMHVTLNKLCARTPQYAPAPVRRTMRPSSSPYTPYACGAQRALLPIAVGSMNIHDVRDRQTSDSIIA